MIDIMVAQCETYENGLRRPTHGYEGPLKVSTGGIFTNIGKDFLDMVSKYDKTRPFVDDPNRMIDDVNRYAVSAPLHLHVMSCLMLWRESSGPSGLERRRGVALTWRITMSTTR